MTVPPFGPHNARIMAVGEAPGETEEQKHKPFVGLAGQLLRNFLQQVGIDDKEVYYTNITGVRPPGNKLHNFFADGGIPNEIVRDGLAELIDQIRSVRPNLIFALGNFPLYLLTGKGHWIDYEKDGKRIRGFTGIHDYRGSLLHSTLVKDFKVLPTFHPSYIQQEGMADHGLFLLDLARGKREAEFPDIRRPNPEIILARTNPEVLANYKEVIDEGRDPRWEPSSWSRLDVRDYLLSQQDVPTTLDIEYLSNKLICCGLTKQRDRACVIPTETLGDLSFLGEIVRRTLSFNAQNSMYDGSILEWHYNLPIMNRVTFDTMVCAYCANIELPKDLGTLNSIYTDQPHYKSMIDWKLVKAGKQPFSIVYAYNGIDTWSQHQVMEEQTKDELSDPNVESSFRFLMRLIPPLWEMSKRGIRIDNELMGSVKDVLESEAAERSLDLMLITDDTRLINVKSNVDVAELLYGKLGLEVIKMNKTGPACDDKTLAELHRRTNDPLAKQVITLIRQQRSARDLRSKFFEIDFDADSRMRGTYDPTKTNTGRLASRTFYPTGHGTNQQNIPRDERARRAFIADRGKVFGYADLEKAESLVVAHLTLDPLMLFDHSPGQNAHRNLGARLFDKPAEDIDKFEYYISKQTRHAGNYMEGPIVMMRNVNKETHKTGFSIDEVEAKRFLTLYRALHSGLPRWWRELEDTVHKTRRLYNLIGFPRTFYDRVSSTLPKIVAFIPQSTVGQVLNIGLLNLCGISTPYVEDLGIWQEYADIKEELDDYGFELLQQIHDAVGFQCWANDIHKVVPLVRRAMSIPLTNPKTREEFRIPVEVLVDLDPERVRTSKSNWGDTKVYKEELVHA